MDRKETIGILKVVTTYYPNFKMDDPKATVDAWHNILQDYDFDVITTNLVSYVKTNRFPPGVADVLHISETKDRAIPNYEETKALMLEWDKAKNNPAREEIAKAAMAEIRKILGINRG